MFASASGDGTVRIWDTNTPQSIHRVAPAHDAEVLTMDWNKYDENMIATGSVDRTVPDLGLEESIDANEGYTGTRVCSTTTKMEPS